MGHMGIDLFNTAVTILRVFQDH